MRVLIIESNEQERVAARKQIREDVEITFISSLEEYNSFPIEHVNFHKCARFDAVLVSTSISEKKDGMIVSGLGFAVALSLVGVCIPVVVVSNIGDKDPLSRAMYTLRTCGLKADNKRRLVVEYGGIGMGGYCAKCWSRALDYLVKY